MQQGIDLACHLPGEIDDLVEGVGVGESGELVPGPQFSISSRTQPSINVALLGLLSVAPRGTRAAALRTIVRTVSMTVAGIPLLKGFDRLEELQLKLSDGVRSEDLRTFGSLPALRILCIAPDRGTTGASLISLAGLAAPALEQLSIRALDLRDVRALGGSPRLQSVDLGGNTMLIRIDGLAAAASSLRSLVLDQCAIHRIDVVADAKQLRRVILQDCCNLDSLEPLFACEALDELDVRGCRLISLKGVPSKLTSLARLPTLDPSVTAIDLDYTELFDLQGIEFPLNIKTLVESGRCE